MKEKRKMRKEEKFRYDGRKGWYALRPNEKMLGIGFDKKPADEIIEVLLDADWIFDDEEELWLAPHTDDRLVMAGILAGMAPRFIPESGETEAGVHYLKAYIPTRFEEGLLRFEADNTRRILGIKAGEPLPLFVAAGQMLDVIRRLVLGDGDNPQEGTNEEALEVDLLAVPNAKTGINRSMARMAAYMISIAAHDPERYGKMKLVDASATLRRMRDIRKAAMSRGNRPTLEEHLETIAFTGHDLIGQDAVLVLLDDITTTGTIMKACTEILLKEGIREERIIRFAYARTEVPRRYQRNRRRRGSAAGGKRE